METIFGCKGQDGSLSGVAGPGLPGVEASSLAVWAERRRRGAPPAPAFRVEAAPAGRTP